MNSKAIFYLLAILMIFVATFSCELTSSPEDQTGFPPGTNDDDDDNYICLPDDISIPEWIEVERSDGDIEVLELEDYVKGVVPQEIGYSFPDEAIKAQAIAARTYAIRWVTYRDEPICDTIWCQVYGEERYPNVDSLVDDTAGVVALYEDEIIEALYFASSGGYTQDAESVWGNYVDYLVAVPCLENALCTNQCDIWPETTCNVEDTDCCYGRYGHGVGMSQRGAQAMAMCGYSHMEILTHYYTGIALAISCD